MGSERQVPGKLSPALEDDELPRSNLRVIKKAMYEASFGELNPKRLKLTVKMMNYLISKGIAKERLCAKGFGFSDPVASNDTEEGRAKNRRVQFNPISD
ncbi:hypothetical protein PITCH_A650016 [uncultured Desulfobacterium sp.]|uniref:OmpA-like domain-containing protein n=1 Tax=uncultured Desulfobacterium sp. TaxID=201089 RepID=A0A445N1L6_9BACT|nr:hypothetical protein PITCH_A650016 [uncultured Desulfobacterium sp.]